jgi:hypothetical protein
MKKVGIFVFILALFAQLPAQVEANLRLNKDTLWLGSPDTLWLELEQERNLTVLWPLLSDSLGPHLEILSKTPLDTLATKDSNTLRYRQGVQVVSYDSGAWVLPTIPFQYLDKQDTIFAEFPEKSIVVLAPAVDLSKDIRGIEGVLDPGYHWMEWLPWLLLSLGLITLFVFAVKWWLRRKQKQKEIPVPIPQEELVNPLEEALQSLEIIRKRADWKQGKVKVYYSDLVDLMRRYIERSYGVEVSEMTSAEWLSWWQRSGLAKQDGGKLKQLLQLADMVKFAKQNPTDQEHLWMVETINSWLLILEKEKQASSNQDLEEKE